LLGAENAGFRRGDVVLAAMGLDRSGGRLAGRIVMWAGWRPRISRYAQLGIWPCSFGLPLALFAACGRLPTHFIIWLAAAWGGPAWARSTA